ncbi:MAG: metallophosphoesterase [Magnetococcales bacterium]|nr:metallophosphoesterase [Magnetococcales bacterium]
MPKIIQITDFHIYADPLRNYRGVIPAKTLQQVLLDIGKKHRDSQLILATGDLVADDFDAYGTLKDDLAILGKPVYVLPGNHDNPKEMKNRLKGDLVNYVSNIQIDGWSIIMLNSAVEGCVEGTLTQHELQILEKNLIDQPNNNILISLHHQPVAVGSKWLDAIGLLNPDELFDIIDKHKQVKGVVFGHIHQEFSSKRNNVYLIGTPSTGLQFRPGTDDVVLSDELPAYRIIDLKSDGTIESTVVRVRA